MRTTTIRSWTGLLTGLALTLTVQAGTQAAGAAPFAAPTAYGATGAGFSVLRLLLALALVLAAVYAAAALMRRLRMTGAAGTAQLQIVTQVALGARERAVLLRAGRQLLLVGVAPGNVRLLSSLADAPEPPAGAAALPAVPSPAAPSFRDLLRRSLGR